MAKKIRFPLEMEQGVEVRSMEELRDNFSLARVLVYVSNGKLITWLRDRYADDIANEIEALSVDDKELPKKVCEIFHVEYNELIAMDLEKAEERNRKLSILKEYTNEQQFLDAIDSVAFSQDEVYDLLDENVKTIFFCGDKFSIPLSKKGITYIGVNNPIVVIDSKDEVNWKEIDIALVDVIYDEKYQELINSYSCKVKQGEDEHHEEAMRQKNENNSLGNYSKDSYLNFMLSPGDRKAAEECYDKLKGQLKDLKYDIDADMKAIREQLINKGLFGLADNYINTL
jgi:hypothetical protein